MVATVSFVVFAAPLTPWAVTGHYMHPIEYLLTAAVALIGPLWVGAHVV